MFRLELAERLGMTLGMLDATMGANELTRWIAKAQVDNAIAKRQERYPQLAFPHQQARGTLRAPRIDRSGPDLSHHTTRL